MEDTNVEVKEEATEEEVVPQKEQPEVDLF